MKAVSVSLRKQRMIIKDSAQRNEKIETPSMNRSFLQRQRWDETDLLRKSHLKLMNLEFLIYIIRKRSKVTQKAKTQKASMGMPTIKRSQHQNTCKSAYLKKKGRWIHQSTKNDRQPQNSIQKWATLKPLLLLQEDLT